MSLPIVRYNNKYYPEFKYVNTNMSMLIDLVKCCTEVILKNCVLYVTFQFPIAQAFHMKL